jgi:hypothetical protein
VQPFLPEGANANENGNANMTNINQKMKEYKHSNYISMVTPEGFQMCKEEFRKNPILLETYLKRYISDFQDLIQEAPKSEQFIKVYRGIPRDFQAGAVGSVITFPFFMSTSLYPDVAHEFMKNGCCLYEFICHPASAKLNITKASVAEMTEKKESEILFAKDTRALILTDLQERMFAIQGFPRMLQVRTVLLFY